MSGRRAVALTAAAITLALFAGLAGRASAPSERVGHAAPSPDGRNHREAQVAAPASQQDHRIAEQHDDPGCSDLRDLTASEGSAAVDERLTVPAAIEQSTGLLDDLETGRPVVGYVTPVASRVTAYTPRTATVEVWTVSVLGTRRLGAASSSWSTETVSLSWKGSWKVTDVRARPGPTPASALAPVTPLHQFLEAIHGMKRYDDAGR